ncbi:hypothetical protein [Halalkalibacter nanhaiisediminis]|uniref:RiboL-PSP-HEPN domain-containing protein n=1 Tax=Halalkalibacter nanhaiisediminis TaxID=688079 RepID=A0A562QMJ2_9BACI|nr:hypothetical protein [Halalkalibacter nanhaiisediminis]TWI57915.1 hypothetical protein IQ10_01244 [Halalkalibacter nanhaiisediminis]
MKNDLVKLNFLEFISEANHAVVSNSNLNSLVFLASEVNFRLVTLSTIINRYINEKKEQEAIFDNLRNTFFNCSDEESERFNPHIGDDLRTTEEAYFLQIDSISKGVLLNSYSLLENSLNDICSVYQKILNLEISYKDIQGSGIERSIKYLKKIIGNENINNNQQWSSIRDWNKIRNVIAHNDGFINESIENIIQKFDLVSYRAFSVNESTVGQMKVHVPLLQCKEFLYLIDEFLSLCIIEINDVS